MTAGVGKMPKMWVTLKPAVASNQVLRVLANEGRITMRDDIFCPPSRISQTTKPGGHRG